MDNYFDSEIYSERASALSLKEFPCQKKVLSTRSLKLSKTKYVYSAVEIAEVSLAFGQYQKSLIQLKRALIKSPNSLSAQVTFAEALFKLEKEDEALSMLKIIMCRNPRHQSSHYLIIERLKERNKLGDLESFYQEIVNTLTNPGSVAELYSISAKALIDLNERSKAFEMYKKACQANPSTGNTCQYACALYRGGEFVEARAQFYKLREMDPTNNVFVNNATFMTYCSGRLQEALEEFEKIIANGSVSISTYSNLILVLYHMDKDEEVINRYRDLVQQDLEENGFTLPTLYEEALKMTTAILERDDIDEQTREFNTKKIEGLNLVLSFIN